jgi:glycosyltransferase involved in cell wall biosynthesis
MKPRQRMLSLDPAGLLWGSERALLDFIGEIPGFDSACCCPPGSPLIEQLKSRNVASIPSFQANLHLRGVGARVLALGGLLRALWRCRPDVLHVNQAGATRIALLACRIFGIPCVAHVRLQEDIDYLNRLRPSPKYLRHLIAISQPIADLIEAQANLRAIPCAMLLDAYRPQCGAGVVAASNGRGSAKWDFVCVGRFCDSKGQEILIRALKVLQQSGSSPKAVFVGEINGCGQKLQNLTKELALEAAVEFAGHCDSVEGVLGNSKWLVCPSRFEPLGRVLFEAWDAGIPVMAGELSGGAAASVNASGGGLLFGEWTPVSLAATMSTALATAPAQADQMAKKGRAWLVEATNPTRYAEAIAGILREAIGSFRRPS